MAFLARALYWKRRSGLLWDANRSGMSFARCRRRLCASCLRPAVEEHAMGLLLANHPGHRAQLYNKLYFDASRPAYVSLRSGYGTD